MDEPVRRRLRAARHRGLTSPDPVTASHRLHRPPGHPRSPARTHGQAAEKWAADKSRPPLPQKISPQARPPEKRSLEFTRWIEAKVVLPGVV
jgi:hypothetical protein